MAGRDVNPYGFGAFKIHVADQLTEPFIERLANYFQFLPALKEKTRGNGLAFVNALLDNGTITEADISKLLMALKDVQLGGLKLTIEQKFMEYMRVAPQVECDAAPIELEPYAMEGEPSIR